MKNKFYSATFKTVVVTIFLFIFCAPIFPKFVANTTEEAYLGTEKIQIQATVIEAAAYFLKSQSDMLSFLNKNELSDLNGIEYVELQTIIHSAVSNMENARIKYAELVMMSEKATYNTDTIGRLKKFDYISFQENNGLNTPLFEEAQNLLSTGDVNGVYSHLLSQTQSILEKLIVIASNIDSDTLPPTANCWRVNQFYAETLLFGQYVTEIFSDITGKNE
jgi:hypothetical protein